MTTLDLERANISMLAARARANRRALGWSLLAVTTTSVGLLWLITVAALTLFA